MIGSAAQATVQAGRQTLTDAGVTTPVRLHGIPQEFLGHAKRDAVLERIGLTPQAIALEVVALMSREAEEPLRSGPASV